MNYIEALCAVTSERAYLLKRCLRLEWELHRVRAQRDALSARMARIVRQSKLDPDRVRRIRRLIRQKVPLAQIAKQFGVTYATISNVSRGRNWWHVIDDE